METLLQKAKKIPIQKNRSVEAITDEMVELGLAFLDGQVSLKQCVFAIYGAGKYGNKIYQDLFFSFVKAYRDGKLICATARESGSDDTRTIQRTNRRLL